MVTRIGKYATLVFIGWFALVIALLMIYQMFSFESVFAFTYIGLLITIQLVDTVSMHERSRYTPIIHFIIFIGVVMFIFIIYRKITSILGT